MSASNHGKSAKPKVNVSKLRETVVRANTMEPHITALEKLRNRLLDFESLVKEREIPTTYVAFEVVSSFLGARMNGCSDDDLKDLWLEGWGESGIVLPAAVVHCIAEGWLRYLNSPSGVTLGEALALEGGGQGKNRIKNRQTKRDFERKAATRVEALYAQVGFDESRSLDDIYNEVSSSPDFRGVSPDTIRRAHRKYRDDVRIKARRYGLIE
jgi:hypothetical protein